MTYPLLGTKIVLDEEKIAKEGKYNMDNLYQQIENYAKENDLIKIDRNTYRGKCDRNDLNRLFIFIHLVREDISLTTNMKQWLWTKENEKDLDIIAKSKSYNMGVW